MRRRHRQVTVGTGPVVVPDCPAAWPNSWPANRPSRHAARPMPAAPTANRVRIIGGSMRGRVVRFPAAPGLRPTPDRVRETLFNWLGQDLAGQALPRPLRGNRGAVARSGVARRRARGRDRAPAGARPCARGQRRNARRRSARGPRRRRQGLARPAKRGSSTSCSPIRRSPRIPGRGCCRCARRGSPRTDSSTPRPAAGWSRRRP